MHVWAVIGFDYAKGIRSDRRAPAYEPMLIEHVEATADGLSILVFGDAMLNWPRMEKYEGSHMLFSCMKNNPKLHVYTLWRVSAHADVQEGFVGVRIGTPCSPPDLTGADEDTIGCIGFAEVLLSRLVLLVRCACHVRLPCAPAL